MKKQRLVREIRKIARTHCVTADLVRQGRHEVWECAGLTFPIPRHNEITEGTARSILRARRPLGEPMTTYKARTYRSGDWWAVEITEGLPDNTLGVTQTRRLTNAEQAARDVIADLLDIDADAIDVDLHLDTPVAVKEAQRRLERLEADLSVARAAEKRARRDLAAAAIDEGLTMREAGLLLGVSHQRVKQLIDDSELIA